MSGLRGKIGAAWRGCALEGLSRRDCSRDAAGPDPARLCSGLGPSWNAVGRPGYLGWVLSSTLSAVFSVPLAALWTTFLVPSLVLIAAFLVGCPVSLAAVSVPSLVLTAAVLVPLATACPVFLAASLVS